MTASKGRIKRTRTQDTDVKSGFKSRTLAITMNINSTNYAYMNHEKEILTQKG
jgi:hypothetical protein